MDTRIDPFAMQFARPTELGMLLGAAGQVRPAFYDEDKQLWVMLRHKQVHAAQRDEARFSASFYKGGPLDGSFLVLDGANHQRERRTFTRAFAPLAVRRAEQDFVLPAARQIIGSMAGRGGAELVSEFCLELPIRVIGALLGVGTEFVREYVAWVPSQIRWIMLPNDPQVAVAGRDAHRRMKDRIRPFVESQVDAPGDNLIGALVEAQRDEGSLDVEKIVLLSAGLLLGGFETTAGMLAATLSALLLHPEALARVYADRDLLMPAAEEAGRWANPTIGVPRQTTCEVDLGEGVVIPAGARVLLCSVGAHYDAASFPRPEVYDIDRRPENLIFGGGPHHCIGASLARLEARIGLSLLLDALPDLRLEAERPPTFRCGVRGTMLHGPEALHVRYDSQARRKAA